MFRSIDPTIKATILKQAKEDGRPIAEISTEFNVSPKTIYWWLWKEVDDTGTQGRTDSSYLTEIHKLRREKEDLLNIIGALSVVAERAKKKSEEERFGAWRHRRK